MIVTELTSQALAWRREKRRMEALGYKLVRGGERLRAPISGREGDRIIDVKIAMCGMGIWYLVGEL